MFTVDAAFAEPVDHMCSRLQTQYEILTMEPKWYKCCFTIFLQELICKQPILKECLICVKTRERKQCHCHLRRLTKVVLSFQR